MRAFSASAPPSAPRRARRCPATCGECAVCEDSASWFFKKSKNTCEAYVSKKSKNCKKRDASGAKAKNACPMTCGAC